MSENITENNQVYQLKEVKRDDRGLIIDYPYKFTEEGLIDWRACVNPKFLYINNDFKNREKLEKKYGKSYDQLDPIKDNIADIDLIIPLSALKTLLRIRGFNYIKYNIKESNEQYASVNCEIGFIGNYESSGKDIIFSENASATLSNTFSFAQKYLLEIATNRSMARCIRNMLNINICSREELGGQSDENLPQVQDNSKQSNLLIDLMDKKRVTWDNLVMKFKSEGRFNENWKKVSDLPKDILFEMIERLKKAKL